MATMEANLYQVDLKVVGGEDANAKVLTSAHESTMKLWHKRLGHLYMKGAPIHRCWHRSWQRCKPNIGL